MKTTTTEYAGNYIYENSQLKLFFIPEGYVEPDDNGEGVVGASEIRREQNYYPFGLEHRGYNGVMSGVKNNLKTYQGQEFTEDLGLNTHEWEYRMSDPAIGRFWQIDPLAEDYVYNSTYAFQENKLGIGIELEGLEVSRHEWLDKNGQNNIRYDAQIKVLNSSNASIDKVIDYANNIAGQIENDFSGTDSDGNKVSTSVSLEFLAEADPENDFFIEFTDQVIKPETGKPTSAEGRTDVIGDAEVNRMQILIPGKSGASYGEPVTEGRLPFTGAHEFGHTVGLKHQVESSTKSPRGLTVGPNNLMRRSNSENRQRGGINGGQLSILQNTVNTPSIVDFKRQIRLSKQRLKNTMNKILNPKL
ncbi:hypothetical protein [Sinomicrobium weinanense]|uniref:RHS repeat-associated core domain-containing protein n=1 Tax=Sinomicrobium weinanense TaxID=2842200 RepID=A0A926JRC5_9FLAO|nr:hypothetical protein [Sinomicrobium weinanense]MBC9795831.1 hypothetical protein [Sinomicrobium weinanense]MBU3125351.1 hypothetical protein [Sinomicrobium weinanense]